MLFYTIIYWLTILFVFFSSVVRNKFLSSFVFPFIAIFIVSLMPGLRGVGVGTDTKNYVSFFWEAQFLGLDQIFFSSLEPGIRLISKTLFFFKLNDQNVFLFICAFLINSLVFYGSKKITKNITLSYAFFLGFSNFYFFSFNVLRQAIAIAFFIFSLSYLISGKYIKYWIYCLFAISFHYSSVILFFMPLLNKKYFGKNLFYLKMFFICFFIVIYSYLVNYFLGLYGILTSDERVMVYEGLKQEVSIKVIFPNIILFSFCLFYLFFIKFYKFNNIKLNLFLYLFFGVIVFQLCFTFLGLRYEGPGRLVSFFYPSLILLIPIMLEYSNLKIKNNLVIYFVLVIFNYIYIYISYTYIGNAHGIFPYDFFKI